MEAYEGYVENGQFYPVGRDMRVSGRRRAVVTILDEPIKPSKQAGLTKEEKERREAWLKKMDAAIDASLDEDFDVIPRSQVMREPVDLRD